MHKELLCFEPVAASIPVHYTTTTATTRFSAIHVIFAVYILQMASTVVGNGIDFYTAISKKVVTVDSPYWNRKELWASSSRNNLLLLTLTLHDMECRLII